MKKLSLIFFALTMFSSIQSSAQSTDSTKFLAGKWKVNDGSIDVLANTQLEAIKKSNPALADQFTLESVREAVKSSIYVYNSDGTFVFTMMGQQDTGTWKFSEDKKSMITKSNLRGTETIRGIVSMRKDKLTLKLKNGATVTYDSVK